MCRALFLVIYVQSLWAEVVYKGANLSIEVEMVYELYGLDAKDREVIEEFLKKF